MTSEAPDSSTFWDLLSLFITIGVVGAVAYGGKIALDAMNKSVADAKGKLGKSGINFSENGMHVKTDRRAMTIEETQDKLQAGIFKGWKASTFKVPTNLSYGTGLAGSSHDKQKEEYEAKYGKKSKKVE